MTRRNVVFHNTLDES